MRRPGLRRKGELLGDSQQVGIGQTTLGRPFPFWQLRTGLGNSPVLGLRQELTDTVTVLKRVPGSGPRSQAGWQISASPDTPQPPPYPVTIPSHLQLLAYTTPSFFFNPMLNLLPKKTR